MDERYAEAYGALARRHWWWRARDAAVRDALTRWVPARSDGRVLDVGCGDGRLFPLLRRFGAVEGIEPAGTPAAAGVDGGAIHAVPFQAPLPVSGPYTLITMLDVLEHLDDPTAALRLCHELLAPGGVLLVTVPALPWLWTSHDEINHHRTRYTAQQLSAVLRESGWTPRALRYLFQGLVPGKLLVRVAEAIRDPGESLPSVPPEPLNAILARAFHLEARVLGPVARWIPGSSLLAVAQPS